MTDVSIVSSKLQVCLLEKQFDISETHVQLLLRMAAPVCMPLTSEGVPFRISTTISLFIVDERESTLARFQANSGDVGHPSRDKRLGTSLTLATVTLVLGPGSGLLETSAIDLQSQKKIQSCSSYYADSADC